MAGDTEETDHLTVLASSIVIAYVQHNPLGAAELPTLINQTYTALQKLGAPVPVEAPSPSKPAVPVKKSVTDDYIICLEDGEHYKSLKRHLQTAHGMSPEEYRAKWDLPPDYPMTAANYSATRSQLARDLGLGRKPAADGPKRGRRPKS
jgi:predicted transcriptional regulator